MSRFPSAASPQVIENHTNGSAQEIVLITLSLKNHPHLGELHAQPSRDALSLQPSGHCGSKIRLEGADPLTCLVALSDSLVVLLVGRAMLQAESFYSLAELISLPT